MNKKTKTTLQFIIAAVVFSSVAFIGCNNSSEKTETKPDSVVVDKPMEATPPAADTTHTMDTASTRPVPTPN